MAPSFPAFRRLDAITQAGSRGADERVTLSGVRGSCLSLVAAAMAAAHPALLVVADIADAEGVEDDLRSLDPETRVILLRPTTEDDIADPETRVDLSERLLHLKQMQELAPRQLVIAPVATFLEALPAEPDTVRRATDLAVGDRCDLDALRRTLHEAGFLSVPMVAAPAEMSIRGDIIDIFPLGEDAPVRVELFDDEVESIRRFDLETQLSVDSLKRVSIPLVRPSDLRASAVSRTFLHQHLPPGALRLFHETARLHERIEEIAAASGVDRGAVKVARTFLEQSPGVSLTTLQPGASLNLDTAPITDTGGGVDGLKASVAALRAQCERVVLLVETEGELTRVQTLLTERGVADDVELVKGRLRSGFVLRDVATAVLSHLELLGKPRLYRPRPRRPAIPSRAVTNLLELSEGDYVVHLTHGVARYTGMTRMKRDSGEEDYLVLEFDAGTTFYLAASKIELVQRYVGADGTPPKLDKIGGKSWAKKKARVAADLESMAGELLELQAARVTREGPPHTRDDTLQHEFELSFPFTDTRDQAQACRDIQHDFDTDRPMDRLICGDVGFGKTEIAVRAAFRVVLGGRQVAVLVPTTLLAEQHRQTFESRFANFPVTVASLSRFRSRKEQNETIEQLKSGAVDIVIGTHRLVSKDVAFKDLGLVVIDEEQRFGVKAKEALKRLRSTVDVLTLSATPIPRTLHMSLIGLRDISSLATPPVGRRPVKTEVHRFDKALIRRAIVHEINRGGQVFFIHNRVQSLERIAETILEAVPTAKVATAHGQMTEAALDRVIRDFQDGKIDVLVSTNIVESGLDLPRANTILIDHPEWYGLADLHQLRGRVGRSSMQAYCYLLLPDKELPSAAEKRMRAVAELSHLGAGYDLAIKDLEIRGAGNLLSGEQHGHIAAVGYDLFVQLLGHAIARAKGTAPPEQPRETDVDLGLEAYLPSAYIKDPGQRMELLRRLGAPDGPPIHVLEQEMRDRFGRIPAPAANLLAQFALKRRCRRLGIRRLLFKGGEQVLLEVSNLRAFRKGNPFEDGETVEMSDRLVHLRLPRDARDPESVLALLKDRMLKRGSRRPNAVH